VRRLRNNAARERVPQSDTQSRARYFTDGSNLYRFVEWLTPTGNPQFATVEDCPHARAPAGQWRLPDQSQPASAAVRRDQTG
jgi:hypothetical protein